MTRRTSNNRTTSKPRSMKNKRLMMILLAVGLLLLIPFVAMWFTDEVRWTGSDFLVAGALLIGTGLLCELVIRRVSAVRARVAICATVLLVLLLTWAELAVGVFGTPFAGS